MLFVEVVNGSILKPAEVIIRTDAENRTDENEERLKPLLSQQMTPRS
jgi:hypothetical protein